jgi:sigma-B regulation protein RsbU (phosphoserine phosphatase)
LFLVDRKRPGELVSRVAEGAQEIRIRFGVGIAGATAQSRQTINIPDAYQDSRFNPAFDKASGFRTRNILSTPLVDQTSQLVGVVQVLNKKGGVFTPADEQFLDGICAHLVVALQRAEMVEAYLQARIVTQSLELAREIQMGLLPKDFPALPQVKEVDIFATIVPALEVGGDLYEFFPLDNDRICFMIGDVSGKGVPAALFMAMARTAFKMAAIAASESAQSQSIALTLNRVNQFLCESNPKHMFVTTFAGILDLATGRVDYVDAGHECPFILKREGTVVEVPKNGGIVLGLLADYEYTPGVLHLKPGDSLVLYTDGVNEAMDTGDRLFGVDAIVTTLSRHGCCSTSHNIVEALLERLRTHVGEAHQSDDITMLVVRYLGRE